MLLVGAAIIVFQPHSEPRPRPGARTRTLVERDGTTHVYAPRLGLGALLTVGVGFVSSLLGIGGGILHVPALVRLLPFPGGYASDYIERMNALRRSPCLARVAFRQFRDMCYTARCLSRSRRFPLKSARGLQG